MSTSILTQHVTWPTALPAPSDATTALVDLIAPVRDEHILVVGPGALEVMCALNARGAVSVIDLPAACRARPEIVDVTVAPNVFSAEAAKIAILRAQRSARPAARLFLRFAPGNTAGLLHTAQQMLLRHGFGPGRVSLVQGRAVLVAGRP